MGSKPPLESWRWENIPMGPVSDELRSRLAEMIANRKPDTELGEAFVASGNPSFGREILEK